MTAKNPSSTCSVSEAARRIGYTRQTLAGWLDDLSYDYAKGVEMRKVIDLLFDRERKKGFQEARKEFAHAEQTIEEAQAAGWISEDEAKRRKLVAQMVQEEIKADEARGRIVRVDLIAVVVREEYGKVREALLAIPDRISSKCAGQDEETIRQMILDEISSVLRNLKEDARRARDDLRAQDEDDEL